MNCSIQSGALYMLATAVPLIHGTGGVVQPSVLMWTATCLAVAYGVWRVVSRRNKTQIA